MEDNDLVKGVLQKMIDDMNGLEAERIRPKVTVMKLSDGSSGIPRPDENEAETPREAEPENMENQHEPLDPKVLKELMDKATNADDDGSLPEDQENAFPEEIQAALDKKRGRH